MADSRRQTLVDAPRHDAGADGTAGAESALARLWGVVGSVVAPASLVTATLFYFGHVSSRAQFEYFGVDVDTLGFSTQEFVMRAPQSLLVPVLGLLLLVAGLVWLDGEARRRLGHAGPEVVRRWRRIVGVTGVGLLGVAMVLLFAYPTLETWPFYPLVTPLLLGVGSGLLARTVHWVPARRASTTTVVLLVAVVVVAVIWVTATLAEWSGTGQAKALARDLTVLPTVVVDTREQLFPGDPNVEEAALEPAAEEGYRFRYRGLRLLAEGDDRLFLVPQAWSPSGSTFVVGLDDARVKFRFVNDPP